MRPIILRMIAVIFGLYPALALADGLDPAKLLVQIQKQVGNQILFSHGSGISLGNGIILTAAHVVSVDPDNPNVKVLMDGVLVPGRVIRIDPAEIRDLALVQVAPEQLTEPKRTQAPLSICAENPGLLKPVWVAAQGQVTRSLTVNTPITAKGQNTNGWTNLLATGYDHGASGGGVFVMGQNCLSGIVYLQMKGPDRVNGGFLNLTAFVPAAEISDFLSSAP